MPPPHSFKTIHSSFSRLFSLRRLFFSFSLISSLALTGCVTTDQAQYQDDYTDGWASRSSQLSSTRSDPLGAYLQSREFAYQQSTTPGETRTLASTALAALGVKYRYGGDTPSTGFDCSGLVIYAAEKSLGLKLPRSSAEIARLGVSVNRTELKKGDLVFFNTLGHRFSHVGIYLGNRKFVHAPRAGSVVRIENMDMAYWQKRYNGARRLVADMAGKTQASQ